MCCNLRTQANYPQTKLGIFSLNSKTINDNYYLISWLIYKNIRGIKVNRYNINTNIIPLLIILIIITNFVNNSI